MRHGFQKVNQAWARGLNASLSRRGLARALGAGALALLVAGAGVGMPAALAAEEKPEYVNKALLAKEPLVKDMAIGKADAPVLMVEYASATCPHCADFHIHEWPLIKKEYVDTGKVRFVFREFPLDQVALAAFMLTRCAAKGDPEKYHAVLGMVMKTQREWAKDPKGGLMKVMRMAGMDEKAFDACLKDEKLAKAIMNSARMASRDFGIQATPTFFVNGRKVNGRRGIEEFRKIIDEELKRAGAGGKAGDKAGATKAEEKPAGKTKAE